jgi:hypothetical protein
MSKRVRTRKAPAQLQREIDEVLAKPVSADTITDKQIRDLLCADLISKWDARGAFRHDPAREESSDSQERREYVANVFNLCRRRL